MLTEGNLMRFLLSVVIAIGHGFWAVVSPEDYMEILKKEEEYQVPLDFGP